MGLSATKTILFMLVGAFFASWVFWVPIVSKNEPIFVWIVSILATFMGLVLIYSLILTLILHPDPVSVDDDAVTFEMLTLFPPGKKVQRFEFAWIREFTLRTRRRANRSTDQWFEIRLNAQAPKEIAKKRTHKIYVQGNWNGDPSRIEYKVQKILEKRGA